MDDQMRMIFLIEIRRQSGFGLLAAQDLQRAVPARDFERCWYSVQSLLIAGGNVSKILWPSRPPRISRRGEDLRALLNVPDNSPLKPRKFRDIFEHFDERLEGWATSSERRNFADSNIGPPGMIAGLEVRDHLRHYDPDRQTLTFRGDEYELRPIIEALRDLVAKAH